jgi:hypothetical protein
MSSAGFAAAAPIRRGRPGVSPLPTDRGLIYICKSRPIRSHLALHEIDGRTKHGRRFHRLLRMASAYGKEEAAARKTSGYDELDVKERDAADAAFDLAVVLSALEPVTIGGAKIFVNVMMVFSDIGRAAGYDDDPKETSGAIGRRLAGTLPRIDGRAQPWAPQRTASAA